MTTTEAVTTGLLVANLAGIVFLVVRSFVLAGRIRDLAVVARWMLERVPGSEPKIPSRFVPNERPHVGQDFGGWHARSRPAPDPAEWDAELRGDPTLDESNPVYRVDAQYASAIEKIAGGGQLTSAEEAEVAEFLARTDNPDRAAIAGGG